MKFLSTSNLIFSVLFIILILFFIGCSKDSDIVQSNNGVSAEAFIEEKSLVPLNPQWKPEDRTFNPDNTVFYKTYYNNFVRGYIMDMKFPEIILNKEIDDYFTMNQKGNKNTDNLVDLFFDPRTIEMDQKNLIKLFYSYGYEINFHNTSIDDLNVRFVEIKEIDGLSLYPSCILIQSWDNEHIYLQDITSPIPRKIRSVIILDDRQEPQIIVHSSGFSPDYISEEELSFWAYRGSYWVLTSIDLKIDSSNAHSAGDMYPDIDRESLFAPVYYQDGIVYRPSIQGDGLHSYTYRLGKMEEIEKNKSFKLIGVREVVGRTLEDSGCFLKFEIN